MKQEGSDWHHFRQNHLCSTDAYKIWGGKDADLMEVWERLMGIGDEILPNDAMIHGRRMEPIARDHFCTIHGEVFWPDVVESKKYKFLGASLDGISFNRDSILEIKCPYSSNMLEKARNGDIDLRYTMQMTHQQLVTDIHQTFFHVYEDEENHHTICYKSLQSDRDQLLEKLTYFWETYVKTKTPPIQERKDSEWTSLERLYWEICDEERRIKVEKENVLKTLKMLANGKSAMGPTLFLSKYHRKGNIDYGKIPELSNIDFEKYRKEPTICWRAQKR